MARSNVEKKLTFRVVTRDKIDRIRTRNFDSIESLARHYTQIGIENLTVDLSLRGLPVFRGLIGPMREDNNTVRYESPKVFELLTLEWQNASPEKQKKVSKKGRQK